jgi:site-specific recombinase XerD
MSVRPRPSAFICGPDAELCSGSTADFESVCPGSNPGSAANHSRSRDNVKCLTLAHDLLNAFLCSRNQGLSLRTVQFYAGYLNNAKRVMGVGVTGLQVKEFIDALPCSQGGKHAYFRTLRAFYNWLYSPKSGLKLKLEDNPILLVDPPKLEKKILPSLAVDQLEYLMSQAGSVRDRAIISLFADTGLRLNELSNIKPSDIDWANRLIKAKCKGNKEGYAVFGKRSEELLKEWLAGYDPNGNVWGINRWGIVKMLRTLSTKTGLPCHAHTFRRTFASILAKRGVDSIHIMRLGRWESIQMVERYTRSVKFEDSLKMYSAVVS